MKFNKTPYDWYLLPTINVRDIGGEKLVSIVFWTWELEF